MAADAGTVATGWVTVFSETFDSGIGPGWWVTDTGASDGGEYTWGVVTFTPTGAISAAWCVGGGVHGISLTGGLDSYPDQVDTWLLSEPLELSGVWDAYVRFRWWLETDIGAPEQVQITGLHQVETTVSPPEEGDWLGWCVVTDTASLDGATCTYVSGATQEWMRGAIPLKVYLPSTRGVTTTVRVAFHFVSDEDEAAGRGGFVDDVELRANYGFRVWLPSVEREYTPTPQPTNLLENGGFEADWGESESHRVLILPADGDPYETDVGNIFTPPGWLTWFYHDPGTWDQPEVRDAWKSSDPRRVHSGEKGMLLFTFYRRHDGGFLQQVDVQPGAQITVSAWAHAWSNWQGGPHPDDPLWSEGPGYDCGFALEGSTGDDDWRNFTFSVGVDPTGGINPLADTVVWGDGAHIYNCYYEVPAVEVEAQSHRVTVFLRSRTLWPFKHNDAYWDHAVLVASGGDGGNGTEWTYPVIEKGSKIGVHGIRPNRVGDFANELVDGGAHFPIVKAVDDLGWLPGIKEGSPETIIIGRVSSSLEGCPSVEQPDTDIDEMANALLSFILNKIRLDPRLRGVVDYWEVVNEPDPPGPQGYSRLAELMIKCMEKAETHDLKLALFSLNAGTPEWDEMEAMVESSVFARAREGGHILALHEGTFATHDPQEGWGSTIPGSPRVPGAGALNFRYRYLYHLLEGRGEVVPLVVSEWYCGDEQSASTETLVDAVKWYDEEASQDYFFWATCPFTLGPTSAWQHTDYERVYEGGLVDYMIQVKDRQNGAPPIQPGSDSLPPGLRR
jgi:hypothetical protein